jgi:hypothetical protein
VSWTAVFVLQHFITGHTNMKMLLAVVAAAMLSGSFVAPASAAIYYGHRVNGHYTHKHCHWHAGQKVCRYH